MELELFSGIPPEVLFNAHLDTRIINDTTHSLFGKTEKQVVDLTHRLDVHRNIVAI